MTMATRSFALAATLLTLAAAARAQTPPLPDPPPPAPPVSNPVLPPVPPEQAPAAGQPHYPAAQLVLGLPADARKQGALYQDGGRSYFLEFNDGGSLTPYGPVGFAAGGRVGFTVAGDGAGGGLMVGPGLDLWTSGPVREVVLAPTVDITVVRDLWPNCRWDLGLNVGTGCFCGRAADYGFPRVFPVLGLSTGFRF
jgi:hypothetical protein